MGPVPWGTHFCNFYETTQDLLDILIPYFKAGLDANEFCLWVVSDPINEAEARKALERMLPEASRRLAAGDIEIVSYAQWYFNDGVLDLAKAVRVLQEKLAQALAKGYAGLRANGEETWLSKNEWGDFLDYEQRINKVIAGHRLIVLCTYPLALQGGAKIFDVARSHEFAIAKRRGNWEMLETPELHLAKAEMWQSNKKLEKRVAQRTFELAESHQALERENRERGQVEKNLRDSRERLRALSARLELLQEEERVRISREIHDELGQNLTSLRMDLIAMERKLGELETSPSVNALVDRMVAATELVDSTITTVQKIAAELRPGVLDRLGLGVGLQYEGRRFEERTSLPCVVRVPEQELALPGELATALFRIFQESLTNVTRHANATAVEAELKVESGAIILRVQDNGKGIREVDAQAPQSLGLLGMKERAALFDGEVLVQRGPQAGTVVTVRIPWPNL